MPGRFVFDDEEATIKPSGRFLIEPTPEEARATAEGIKADVLRGIGYTGAAPAPVMRPLSDVAAVGQNFGIVPEIGRQLVGGMTDVGGAVGLGLQSMGRLLDRASAPSRTTGDMALGAGDTAILASGAEIPTPGIAARITKPVSELLKATGKEVGGYWGDAGEQYQQSTDIQGSVVKKPELLANPKWWASNIARMTPGLAASLMVSYATGGGSLLAGAGKSTARTVGGLLGGIAGGLMEGQGTEREALKRGMSEDEAIDAGMKMTEVAGILNAISLDSMLNPSARKWLARFLISGSTEAVTEYGEEPAEGIILGEDWETFKKRLIDGVNVLGPAFFTGGPAAVLAGGNAGPEQADTPPLAPRTEQKQAEIPTPPPPAPPQTGPAAESARAFMRHWANQAADEKNLADVTEQARQVNQSPQGAEGLRRMLMKEEERGILEERRARRNADIEASNQLADEAIRARKATPEDMAEYGKTRDEGLANQRQAKRLVNETITGERREALKTLRNDVYDAMRSGEIEFEELPALAESYRKDGLKPEADLIDEIFTRPRAAEQKKTGRVADETVLAPEPQQNKAMPPADETGSAKSETSAGAPNVLNQPATAVTDGPRLISAPVVSQETQPGERQTTKTITDETQTYGLGEREQAFIRDKVKKFGSRDAAMKFYGGKSPVDMFGRYVADQVYGKKSALGITPRKNASTQQSEQSPTTAAPEIIDTVRRNGKRYKVIKHADGRMEIYRKHGGTEERHAYDMDGYRQDKERMTKAADRTSGSKKKYIHISANKLGPAARILLGKGIKRATGADLGELVDLWDGIRVVGHRTVDPQAQAQEDRWVAEWADHEGVPQGVTFEDMLAEARKEIERAISKNTETQGETHPDAMAEREADQRKEWLDMGLTNDDITNILATEGDMQSNALDLLASRGQFTEKVLNGYRNEGFTDEDIADIRAGQNPADIRSSIRQALQDGLQDGLDETAQAIRGVSGEEREDPSSTPGGAEEFFAGLAEATATPTSESIFTEQAPRTIPADRTTALFDTKDARTGEPIAAGEIVYFLTDTKETVKESTYRGMTERAAQGELFAPKAAGKKPAEDKAEKQKPTPAQSLEFTTEPIRNTEAAQTSMMDEMDGQGDLFAEDRGKKTRIAEPRADRTDVITPEGTVIVDGYVVDTETGEVTGEVLPNGSIESLKRETPSKAVSGRKADTVEDVKNIFPKATGVTRNDDGSYTVNVGKKSIMYRPAPGTAFLLDETGKSRYIPSKKGGEDDRSIEPDADNRRHENAGAKIEKPSAERIGSAIRSIARDIGVSPGGITETSAPSREDSGLAVRVAHIFGHYPVFIKTEEEGIFTVIGVAHDDIVFINGETDHPHVHVVSHEIVHALRKKHPDLYQKLYEAVHEDAIAFDRFLQKERAAMPWALNDYIAHEFVAYTVSERMYERGFWRNLYAKIPDVVRNILNSLNRIINTIALDPKYKTSTYFKDIKKVRDTIDSVMTEYARRENKVDEPRFMTRKGPRFSARKDNWYYSQMRRTLESKLPNRGAMTAFRNMIQSWANKGEFKAEELEWSGLLDADGPLAGTGTVSKDDVLAWLDANNVRVEEVMLTLPSGAPGLNTTRYDSYQEPGGENYRELLLTLPEKQLPNKDAARRHYETFIRKGGEPNWQELSDIDKEKVIRTMPTAARRDNGAFRSAHFDTPNILAHVRFNERTDAEGNRVLFVEEIQSDWHQKGREKGYKEKINLAWDKSGEGSHGLGEYRLKGTNRTIKIDVEPKGFYVYEEGGVLGRAHDTLDAAQRDGESFAKEAMLSQGVPNAPFKKSWPMLAMKRMIRYAAENGFDSIAWTTGEMQAERYDLSKQVGELAYWKDEDEYGLSAETPDGQEIFSQKYVTEKELPSVVGKDVAQKIINDEGDTESLMGFPKDTRVKYLRGDDLKVGGEGMKGFYNQILPAEVQRYVKKWGAKVGETKIYTDPEGTRRMAKRLGKEPLPIPVHSLTITPAMREAALAGQPLFRSTSPTATHITGPAVERAVSEIAAKFNVPVRVVATAAELPRDIRNAAMRRQSEGDVVLGIYHGGKVWIVAEHMRSADEARKVFIHEAVGHYGLRKVMGKDFETFLDFLVNDTKYGAEIKAFAKEYGISDPREAADEWFARQSETMKPNSSLWSRFMFHVRKWLRSLGATIEYGKPELVELLRVSREAARKGGRITAGAGVRYRGYDWDAGKSNNAVDAEASGRYPASKVAKMLGVPIEVVRAFDTQEYHHTGKYFNTTKYYDVDEVRDWVNDPDNADEIARIKAESKATAPAIESTGHTVAWLEWSGTRNHPKATTVTEKNVTIEDTGGKFLNIITSDGNTIRKGRDTKGFEIDGRPAYLFKIKTAEQSSERPVPPRSKTSGEVKGVQKDRDGRITQPDAGVKGKIPDEDADPDIRFSTRLSAAATRSTDAVISDYKRTSAIGKALTPISTALERIHPRLKYGKNNGLRGVESRIAIRIREDTQSVLPLLQSVKKKIRDKADIKAWDLARKNSDEAGILRIVKKYGLGAEYGKYRMMEDGIFKRAREAGYSVKYLKEHWARMIRDEEGFLKYLHNTTEWGMIDEAIKAAEEKGKKLLSDREKAVIANRVLRGPTIEQVNLPTPGNVKKRTIREIDDELNKYYFDADTSVLKYIELMNKNIEARKYFGVGPKADVSPMDPLMDEQLDESIGMFVAKQRQELHLTPEKENELVAVLRARFNYRPLGGMFQHIKELGYLTAMGSGISSTITQLGDIPYAFYIAPKDAARAMMRAFNGKSPVDVYGLGIERIAEEFSDIGKLGKALRVIFKGIGLAKMDTVFKETLVNAAVAKMQRQAREGNIDEDLHYRIDAIFGSEKDAVIADLKANRISEDVKLLAFNILCDFQPVALSEMPAEYLSGETGGKLSRLFYMMKTYTIKQMDVIRREAIWDIKRGNYARGSARFASLIATLILANMSADAIKDWIFRRRTDLSDLVVDNILKLVGISRYLTWSFRTDGIKMSIARLLLPPTDVIELPVKDVWSAGKAIKEGEEFDVRELQSLRMIPVAGQMYHWWFGGGKASRIKRDRTMILKDIEQYYQKPDKARAEKLIAQMKEYNAHAPKDKKITKRTLSSIQARVKRERRIR